MRCYASQPMGPIRILPTTAACLSLLGFAASTAAQSGGVYVNHEKVDAALAEGRVLIADPQVSVAGGHRDNYLVTVPVLAAGAKAEVVYAGHDRVAPADYRPDVEMHTTEGDLFYVIDGRSTQVLGGTVIGGRETAPG